MSSNAINLGLNVESALPKIHMHLYLNYKHKRNILTYLYKKYAHEIIKQGEKSNWIGMLIENWKSKSRFFSEGPCSLMSLLFSSIIIDTKVKKSIIFIGFLAPSQPTWTSIIQIFITKMRESNFLIRNCDY